MTDENDIVNRLRGAAAKTYGCACDKCQAADEITRLGAEVAALKADANLLSLNAVIKTLQAEVAALKAERDLYAAEIARVTAERDEARREVCELRYTPSEDNNNIWYAGTRGWDCFDAKEVQP